MALIAPASVLAFAGAFFMASQAVTIKYGSRKARATMSSPAFAAALTTIVVSVCIFWTLLVIQGVPADALTLTNAAPFVVAGLLNPAAFRFLYFTGIDEVGAPIAAALMAMNPLVATAVAVPVLGETLTLATGLGVLCIVAGGMIVQTVQNTADDPADADGELDVVTRQLAQADRRALLFPLGAMVVFGLSYVLIEFGLTQFPDPVYGTTVAQTTALIGFLAALAWAPSIRREVRSINRPALAIFLLAGVLTACAQLANFFALNIGTAVTVIPLFNTFPLLVLVFTYAIAREIPRSRAIVAGVLAIVVGSILVELL